MRIAMSPRYDRNAASSRLRVYAIADELQRQGHDVSIAPPNHITANTACDVYFFQKTDEILPQRPVIYDYDDIWDLRRFAGRVTTFTTDTDIHMELAPGPCRVFPDPIGYNPSEPLPPADRNTLGWFGNYPCWESARPLLQSVSIPVVAISDRQFPGLHINAPWRYDTFPRVMREVGTAFLSHAGMDPGKSNNKLTAAVTLGVPVIAGKGSPSYEALLAECRLGWAIVSTPEELTAAWQRLQIMSERESYLRAIQPLVWDRYRVEVVAKRFLEICESML